MSVLLKVLLQTILLAAAIISASGQVCYSSRSSYTSNVYYSGRLYYYSTSYTYYVSCGSWWRRSRCSRTGYSQRSGYRRSTMYRSVLQYSRTSRCCAGYTGTPPNCLPVCSICHNGGTCVAPQTCRCASGWIGSTCNEVPTPIITALPSGPIQGAMVGSPQDIRCRANTISGVSLSSVNISWTRPGGESIINNSRVTISPTTSNGTNYTSSLQFTYLMEGDEGIYTCNVMIVNAQNSISLQLANLTVPAPSVVINAPTIQIVGQSLVLKCDVTTVKGITSSVNVIWSRDRISLKRTEGIAVSSVTRQSLLYKDAYSITQLSTADENKMYWCMAVIAGSSSVRTTESVMLNVTIPFINIIMLPPGPIQGAMVGSPQDIQCIVSTVSGVELSSVIISWMGPGGESITNDTRVTISPTISSGNNYTSSLQFTYLMEGDEGVYTCNVMILEAINSSSSELSNLTIPIPSVTVNILNNQTVGQMLMMKCDVTAVRGITSRVDIVWSSNGSELKSIKGANVSLVTDNWVLFTSTYVIPQLSTKDEGRECQCEIVIDTNSSVMAADVVTLNVTVSYINITTLPSGPIQRAMVGSPQDIQCIVSTVSGVELSSVMISWMGPGGESITNNSRVTISPTTSSGNNYTSSLQFTYLMEGDEGMYTCNVMILETRANTTLEIFELTVPVPDSTSVTVVGNQTVGQSLMLKCTVTTVKGITSRMDIVWSSNSYELKRTEGVNSYFTSDNSVTYTDSYNAIQINTSDDGRVFDCKLLVNTIPLLIIDGSVTLDVIVPIPTITMLPSGPIQGAVVGSPQDIQCIVSTVSGVELSSVMISWMGPGGEFITNDSRMTISPTISSGNNYTSSLQFIYLMEGDEGMYTCNVVILGTRVSFNIDLHNLTIPNSTNITVTPPNTEIVGQSLALECSVTTVRGITSRIDIEWSTGDVVLKKTKGINVASTTSGFMLYESIYSISPVSTLDDGRVYHCKVIINTIPQLMATDSTTLDVIVPNPTIYTLPSGPIQGAMVGSPQDIQCIVRTVSGVELSSVMISWVGPGGESITNDSRVTISPTTSSGNNYTSSLQFTYLMEGDEGIYTCIVVILETREFVFINFQNLKVPNTTNVTVTAPSTQIVGQSLILECSVATVRGITSRVDIEWSFGNRVLQSTEGADITSTASDFVVYTDFYNISQVSTLDDGRVYQCKVIINTIPQLMATDRTTLDVTVPNPTMIIIPSGSIQRAVVGSPLDIQCIVSTVSGVELSSVVISWMEPRGKSITNDSRVTISPTTSSGNNYTSSLQFTYLMEGDEGMYTCNVMILKTNLSHFINMQNPTVPNSTNVTVTTPSTQIVGQSLILKCSVTTVRGITSRVDIEWSTGNMMLQKENGINVALTMPNTVVYKNSYNISQVSTLDDDRVYQCKVIINTIPQLMATRSTTLDVTVPNPAIIISPPGPIQGAMVGSPQDIQCIVSTVSGVELSSVMISWMGPGGESITNDSRVTISPTTSSGNNYTCSLQFTYLMEGDEGMYTCNVMILETKNFSLLQLNILTVPNTTNVTVTAPATQIVGQSLILECSVTTVRGVTSRVDIEWSVGNRVLQSTEGTDITSTASDFVLYTDFYNISQVSTLDDGRVYQCKVIINTIPQLMATDSTTLDVTVPDPTVLILPSGPMQGATVGSPLGLECVVSAVSGVDSNSVMITWIAPNGIRITGNSRVIVNPVTSIGNNYTSGLHFIYLVEGDEGTYTCKVMILENTQTGVIELGNLTFSHSTNMTVVTLNDQIVGQPLMLECEMSTPRGINSRVDIVWTRDGVEIEHINDVSSNFSSPEVVVYTNIYTIPILGTIDDDVVYECEVIISSNLLHNIARNVTLDVIVPIPTIAISPPSPIKRAVVGSPLSIVCAVNTVDGVESSLVTINWVIPKESYNNNSRITVEMDEIKPNPLNTYNSSLQFAYLMEGDEGMYTCRVAIMDTVNQHTAEIESLTIPKPLINIVILNNATVSQPLTLECSVTTVRGITSRVDIQWNSNGSKLKIIKGLNHSSTTNDSVTYTGFYTIPQLSTLDEGRTLMCYVIVNGVSPVMATDGVTLNVTVPFYNIIISPSGPIQGAMVGSPQDIQCIVSTVDGVELSSVMISWMGPGGESITNDSRVTISPTTSSGNNYTSSLQFTYLMEGDEGMYTCNVMILETSRSKSFTINSLTIPLPSVTIYAPDNQIVGQSLTLQCNATTVRGITSRVDIVWSSNGVELKQTRNATVISIHEHSELFLDSYYMTLLSTTDDGRELKCKIVIIATPAITTANNAILHVTVPTPTISFAPDPIQGAMVGSPQDIQCVVSTVSGVKLSSVMINWMGPGGESITNDSRVTISPTTSSGNNYTSSLQFTYLMEGDEGMYTCNVMILETNGTRSVGLNNLIVPTPYNTSVVAHNVQTVGQSLLLECIVTTVRGITSTMDIVWTSHNVVLRTERNVSINFTTSYSASYTSTYIIPQLSTLDDGRVYNCEIVINSNPAVSDTGRIELDIIVPLPILTILPSGLIQGTMVGSPQDIQCIVSTVSGVELSSVMISWMGPGGESITNDSRVTISPTTSSDNNYTSSLQFTYLMEGDEGIYICSVMILKTNVSDSFKLSSFIIPVPNQVSVTAVTSQMVGHQLTLKCSVTTVRGITSRVNTMWSSNGLDLETIEANISSISNDSVEYTTYYTIVQLNETDDSRVYQCKVEINGSLLVTANSNITLNTSIPSPSVMLKVLGMQTVGQLLPMECIVTTVRGITSRLDIEWSSDDVEVKKTLGVNVSSLNNIFMVYRDLYNVSLLTTAEEGRAYKCKGVINTNPSIITESSIILDVIVPHPFITILPHNHTFGAMVGSPQDIQCIVSTGSGVESSLVMIGWMGPGGESMTNDSRVTISPTTSNGDNYTSSLQFTYLTEGDEGIYTCNVTILETRGSSAVELKPNVPDPVVTVFAPSIQTVSNPLTLECNVSTVRGITSSMDTVWSSNGLELKRSEGMKSNVIKNDSVMYMDSYTIPQLGTVDEGRTYQCGIIINQILPITVNDSITLDVTVPKILIDISQSVEGSIVGLPHTLICTATVAQGVSPSLVKVDWKGSTSLSESPRVAIFNQTIARSYHKLKFIRTITFSPLLAHDAGEYICSVTVTGFDRIGISGSVIVAANAPTLMTKIFPLLLTGDSGEDPIELLCTAIVREDVMLASYQFTWIKDDTPVDMSNERFMVTNNYNTSSFIIEAINTNATLDNGIYSCQGSLTISGVNSFNATASYISTVLFKAMIPPNKFIKIEVITAPHSVEISWMTPYIILDRETYSVQYSTDVSLQSSSKVIIEATNRFTINETFSIYVIGLSPFTTYYYIIQANNSAGNTFTDVMNFTTNHTAPSIAPSNFLAVNITSTSITFNWDNLVNEANGIIQFYVITCTTDDNNIIIVNVTGAYTVRTLNNLRPYTSYNCTLHAVTVSDGPLSNLITVTTAEQAPTAPIVRDVTAVDDESVRIQWNIPMDTNGVLSMYTIFYTIENGPERNITVPFNGQDVQFYDISGLSPYQMVTVTITATNGAGTSGKSNEVSGRTEEAAPGLVEIVDVVPVSDTASTVVWSPPLQPNGIVTNYELIHSIYKKSTNISVNISSNAENFTITDLNPGIPYQVNLVAFTNAGRGVQSNPYIFFTKELIPVNPPENITMIYEKGGATIAVSWEPVSLFEARGFPTYIVTLTPSSLVNSRTTRQSNGDRVTTNETDVIIQDLDPNVEYSLTVAVETSAGRVISEEIKIGVKSQPISGGTSEDSSNKAFAIAIPILVVVIIIIIIVIYLVRKQRIQKSKMTSSNDRMDIRLADSFQENSCAEINLYETVMSNSLESVKDAKELSETADTDTINSIENVTATPSDSGSMNFTYEKIKSNSQEQNATIYRNPCTDDEELIKDESPCATELTAAESSNANVENTNITT